MLTMALCAARCGPQMPLPVPDAAQKNRKKHYCGNVAACCLPQ